ncbi:LuxR C-terminal-related transcriptional regulator [uncultured Microbacterium sp.]|uniref:LuxR C-terminal-related transcriptional regulator n=1 Tax=uncultured Microbacterium sp. TaxID=191216 RepID=UPI0028D6BAE4|nr:LuxR C-terminal-related transcriptional regulator [uncultured Microbacterium sp.]
MSTISTTPSGPVRADNLFIWERQGRPVMDAIAAPDAGPARAVVVGNAGSGKSTMLRELHRLLEDNSAHASVLADSTDVARVPRSHVLLVDDLHLLGREQIEGLRVRADDPQSALVVTSRPFPRIEALASITRRLERSRPTIVLGHVSRSDVLTYLEEGDRVIASSCVDELLELTGGVSWLVSEALALHDTRDCADDRGHRALTRAIEDRIAHRLDTIPSPLRHDIEALCVAPGPQSRPLTELDDVIAQGYAEGLLAHNGQPVPLVRSAVRATIPVGRLIDLSTSLADGLAGSAAEGDPGYRDWIGGIHDSGIGAALVAHADRMLEQEPVRALELYDGALECGTDGAGIAGRRAQAAWSSGRPELAASILDSVPLGDALSTSAPVDCDRIVDTSAAIWSLRGLMRMGHEVYRSVAPHGVDSHARATIAALGAGHPIESDGPSRGLPSTLGVAMELLERGLRATVTDTAADSAVGDLVRASEMYTSSGSSAPIPELPAVIAAIVALNVGDLNVAHAVIEDAIRGEQGGEWARTRLLLWRSWLAVQRSRPQEAREALTKALDSSSSLSARDRLLAQAVRVTLARRYEDAAALAAVWAEARDSVLHVEADLFVLLPLAELITSAVRRDDTPRLQPHFDRAIQIVEQLGLPPIWSVHLSWAGIQRGILRGSPEELKPHARALVAASRHSPMAAVMAQAGRVWTATLGGSVDADAIEAAAHGLASAGLGWDGARLAGHGASRVQDRKVAARLLAVARELHPVEAVRKPSRPEDESRSSTGGPKNVVLSERELDVARLVLQGKTYAEIGETIFISPRTAEHHIAHMRRRLGATSRSDLLARLRVVVDRSTADEDSSPSDEGTHGPTP